MFCIYIIIVKESQAYTAVAINTGTCELVIFMKWF